MGQVVGCLGHGYSADDPTRDVTPETDRLETQMPLLYWSYSDVSFRLTTC